MLRVYDASPPIQRHPVRELILARMQYLIQQTGGGDIAVVTLLLIAKGVSCSFVAASHRKHGSQRKADCCRIEDQCGQVTELPVDQGVTIR